MQFARVILYVLNLIVKGKKKKNLTLNFALLKKFTFLVITFSWILWKDLSMMDGNFKNVLICPYR